MMENDSPLPMEFTALRVDQVIEDSTFKCGLQCAYSKVDSERDHRSLILQAACVRKFVAKAALSGSTWNAGNACDGEDVSGMKRKGARDQ